MKIARFIIIVFIIISIWCVFFLALLVALNYNFFDVWLAQKSPQQLPYYCRPASIGRLVNVFAAGGIKVQILHVLLVRRLSPKANFKNPFTESTTTCVAGGLDFTAIGGKGGARNAPIVAVWKTLSARPFAVKLLCKCAFIIQKFSEPGFNGAIVSSLIRFQVFDKIG